MYVTHEYGKPIVIVTSNQMNACVSQTTIKSCGDLIARGWMLDDVMSDPLGPVSKLVGQCDIDVLAECVALAVQSRYQTIQMITRNVTN